MRADEMEGVIARRFEAGRLGYAALTLGIIAAAVGLRWPGLLAGLHTDDYVQEAMLDGAFPVSRSPLALYDFGGRDETDRSRLRDFGWFAWWSAPELEIAMFRPLSSALVAVDHALARTAPALRHVHSLAFFVALLAGLGVLLRGLLPGPAALLALALFAADSALTVPLAWLPNRCALTAAAFGVFGLHAYLCWRRRGSRWGAIVAPCAFGLAVLAGEYGLVLACYPIAFEWVAARDPLAARLRALVVVLAPMGLVVALSAGLGYGVKGSAYYISPLSAPAHYASACLMRVPVLAAELVLSVPAASAQHVANGSQTMLGLGVGFCALLLLALMWRGLAARAAPEPRFLGLGSLLGLPLLAGALPEARLLVPVAFGFHAVLSVLLLALIRAAFDRNARSKPSRSIAAALAVAIVGLHFGVEPARAFAAARSLRARSASHARWALDAEVDDALARRQQWFVVAAADYTTSSILPFVRRYYGHPLPRAYRLLSAARQAHEIERIDCYTLELSVLGSSGAPAFAGSLQRPRSQPFVTGAQSDAGGLRVRVLRVFDGQPVRMRFTFPKPVDDPAYAFLHPMRDGVRRVAMPHVGGRLRLPPPSSPRRVLF
jgi:hypothetical protein